MTHPYTSEAYARAFGGEYTPILLANAGIWMLSRPIAGSERRDAVGCYPRCPLPVNVDFAADFAALAAQGIVSLVLVTDVFLQPNQAALRRQFDHVHPYKTHYLIELSREAAYSKHHRDRVRRAQRRCETRDIELGAYLPTWNTLYAGLVARHAISGAQNFSYTYFAALAQMPGLRATGAFVDGELVAAILWFIHEGIAYSHLTASNERGYDVMAAYALNDFAIRSFREGGLLAVDLGAGAGIDVASTGLSFFKKGFSNAERQCFLAGKILNAEAYVDLCEMNGTRADFFPAYR
jgi:hypothetical protein